LSCRKSVFKAIEIAKANNVLVSFDPNIRLKLWTKEEAIPVLLKIAKLSDIIFPGIDEGEMLLGLTKPEEIADTFMQMGCSVVVVKLGTKGCYIADSVNELYVNAYKVENPEDTVGAGDGFSAGFLSGMLNKLDFKECGEYGNGVGAMAVLVKGDMEGYPNLEQLMEFIGKKKTVER